MTALIDLCALVRSKNAGPFLLTFDIMCREQEDFERIVTSGVLTEELFAQLYDVPVDLVLLKAHPNALAVKVTIPRPEIQGSANDLDCYGGQQHALILKLDIP